MVVVATTLSLATGAVSKSYHGWSKRRRPSLKHNIEYTDTSELGGMDYQDEEALSPVKFSADPLVRFSGSP